MVCRAYKKLILFSLWAMLLCVAVPVFAQVTTDVSVAASKPAVAASTTSSTSWTPANWIALITAISSAFVAVVGALKGMAAQKTADGNSNRLNNHGQQITALAQNQLPPAMLASLMPKTPQ